MHRIRTPLWALLVALLAVALVAAACGDDDEGTVVVDRLAAEQGGEQMDDADEQPGDADEEAAAGVVPSCQPGSQLANSGRTALDVTGLEAEPVAVGDFAGAALTLVTHDSFNISEETITSFEEEHGVDVQILPTGDAVESLNRAILTKENPEGDLLFGVDNISFVRGLAEDLFVPYVSPELANVPGRWMFDASANVTPVDYGYVLFNYEVAALEEAGVDPPTSLGALASEAFRGKVAVEDPNTSSPGLQLMLATIGCFGETGDFTWLDWWSAMRDNDLIVTADWTDAYFTRFSQYGGDAWVVNSYATSPPAEVIFAEADPPLTESPTANVLIDGATYLQIEGVGILRNSENVELAKLFIDHMLSQAFQEDIPLNMFVYPVREGAALPSEFDQFADVPETVALIDPQRVEEKLEDWLDEWTDTVVR